MNLGYRCVDSGSVEIIDVGWFMAFSSLNIRITLCLFIMADGMFCITSFSIYQASFFLKPRLYLDARRSRYSLFVS